MKLRDEKKNPFIELEGQVPKEDILEQTKILSRNDLLESMVWADNTDSYLGECFSGRGKIFS